MGEEDNEDKAILLPLACDWQFDDGSKCALKPTVYLWHYELIGHYCQEHGEQMRDWWNSK